MVLGQIVQAGKGQAMTTHKIRGLHHVTLMARNAVRNNWFFTEALGLRRVKKTVNFDDPSVYHLYYGTEKGAPGTVMTYFPFPHISRGRKGTGEVGLTAFSVPKGALSFWQRRLANYGVTKLARDFLFREERLIFHGPDDEELALVECDDARAPWLGSDVPPEVAIRGFHSVQIRLDDARGTAQLLHLLGYREKERLSGQSGIRRFEIVTDKPNGAGFIDLEADAESPPAREGAGSVHHIAFAVDDLAAQDALRRILLDAGQKVTPVIDRDYFHAIYFRTAGGVLFEIATNAPGFDRDEDAADLGQNLQLPAQHQHLRASLEKTLPALEADSQ